jgi:2-keto-3-deoxy-6-phosphogluconate aldolase
LAIVNALYEGGVRCVEITLNSPGALKVIENIALQMEDKVVMGLVQCLMRLLQVMPFQPAQNL